MKRVVHPGPVEPTLLKLQSDHRSEWLWKEKIPYDLCIRPIKIDTAWSLFTSHPPHQYVKEYLSSAKLYDVVRVGRMQYDRHLLTNMVERWHSESHCFHLLFGETMITLQDVQVLFGLHVDGHPLYLQDIFGRGRSWRDIIEALAGYVGPINGRSFVSLTNLINFIKDELEIKLIGDDTPISRVEKIARLYMMVILRGILFPNASGIFIRLHFVAFLDPICDVGSYSWGSAVLACLYRSLCCSSYKDADVLYAYLPLIQVWCWERMFSLQPGLYDSEDDDVALLYATIWTRGIERNTELHHTLIAIRDQIDHMMEAQFVCRSYDAILHILPLYSKIDRRVWTARVSLFFLEVGEYHVPDRVMRQFGLPQHIPQPPKWNPEHFDVDLCTRVDQSLDDLLGGYFNDWRDQHKNLSWTVHGAVLRDYALWFLRHGWLLVANPVVKVKYKAGFISHPGTIAALSRGLFKILNIFLEVQKDPAHALWGHEIESVVQQTFKEAGESIPLDGPFCDSDSSYYNVNARGCGKGRGRGRGRGRPRGRPRNVTVHKLFNEPSPSTTIVLFEAIPDKAGPYSMRLMELPSRPADEIPSLICLFLTPFAKPKKYARVIHSPYGSDLPMTRSNPVFGRRRVHYYRCTDDLPTRAKSASYECKKKRKEILPTKTRKDSDGFRPLDALRKPKECGT
ncbi:putative nudix hydrolase 18, mitochondrial-like [Capsicum annuum]|nr:putative nudix hydrolase 18, mitochondrial-like [Capsicum annuum]